MRLLTDADAWQPHHPTTYAQLNYERDQRREQEARAACRTAPAAPVLRIDGTYVETDCIEIDQVASVDLPDDQPDPDGFVDGFDDYPDLLNDMRQEARR